MTKVRAAVLYGVGLNCDQETAYAFEQAGASADRVLVGRLVDGRQDLSSYDIFAIPGGFSYADDIAAGTVLATKLKHSQLGEQLERFIEEGKPVIGICNGYQALVKAGFLPDLDGTSRQEVTLTYNDSGRFEDRWVRLQRTSDLSVFTHDIDSLELPVRHGEGKFFCNEEILQRLEENNLVVFRYVGRNGEENPGYPYNPNGSIDNTAAICNRQGNVLGIMPHPEGFIFREQHPRWTREEAPEEGLGMRLFRNAVKYVT